MTLFSLLLSYFFQVSFALPQFPAPTATPAVFERSIRSELKGLSDTRSLPDIVLGCFATIFACTWVAVHPNIMPQKDGDWAVLRHRLKIMAYTLLVPELILYWASKQWYAASQAEKKHRDKGWTKAHGFFIGMGGLVLAEQGHHSQRPVDLGYIEDSLELGLMGWPKIQKEDILDKSKGDYLTKGIAVIQISWFSAQCLSRAALGLTIPQLELTTLAFALLTCVMYYFWWDKPLDVRRPIGIFSKGTKGVKFATNPEDINISDDGHPSTPLNFNRIGISYRQRLRLRRARSLPSILLSSDIVTLNDVYSCSSFDTKKRDFLSSSPVQDEPDHNFKQALNSLSPVPSLSPRTRHSALPQHPSRSHYEARKMRRSWAYCTNLLYPIRILINDAYEMKDSGYITADSVSQFYAAVRLGIDHWLSILLFLIGTIFGGIHCVAWSFGFPSTAEKWLWRSASIGVVALPALIAGNFLLVNFMYYSDSYIPGERVRFTYPLSGFRSVVGRLLVNTAPARLFILFGLYITSRLVLLILPLVQLRALPASAYQSIDWTGLIPHVL